ncbi:hypothetical protein LSAT2_007081 [Lamellibrachia satsuma]|nr:hypothetical protein LSAT2_007081 [Lamellibrachia satsuma]
MAGGEGRWGEGRWGGDCERVRDGEMDIEGESGREVREGERERGRERDGEGGRTRGRREGEREIGRYGQRAICLLSKIDRPKMALTEDWNPLGDVFYRKQELYSMEWSVDIDPEKFLIAVAPYGGPIALMRNDKNVPKAQRVTTKPFINIYTSAGRDIAHFKENIMTQHKPVVFVMCMQKKRQTKTVGCRTIKWWRCKDDVAVEYKERVTVKYEELSEEVGGLEEEWKKYQEAFVGAAEELCGRTLGKAEYQDVVTKDCGQVRLQRQYVKRRKPGKKLKRPRREEINQIQG